jgi:hypothetical protein
MSARNTLESKRSRRANRTLRKGVLPAYIDLIEWVKGRSSLTTGTARAVVLSGALKVDSHSLGTDGNFLVPADLNGRIRVEAPQSMKDEHVSA